MTGVDFFYLIAQRCDSIITLLSLRAASRASLKACDKLDYIQKYIDVVKNDQAHVVEWLCFQMSLRDDLYGVQCLGRKYMICPRLAEVICVGSYLSQKEMLLDYPYIYILRYQHIYRLLRKRRAALTVRKYTRYEVVLAIAAVVLGKVYSRDTIPVLSHLVKNCPRAHVHIYYCAIALCIKLGHLDVAKEIQTMFEFDPSIFDESSMSDQIDSFLHETFAHFPLFMFT